MPMMMRNSSGIITLENFSIPFCTPAITIPAVRTRKMVWQTIGSQTEVEKAENMVFRLSGLPSVKSKQTDLKRYSVHQPPTTE